MITEQLDSLGAWSVDLADDTPRSVTDQLGFFGHIGIWQGRVDIDLTADATLLASARYVGVLREKPTGRTSLEGSGMLFWLGDEDGKGAVLESPVVFTAKSLTYCVTALLPPAVTVGTIHDPGGTYTGKHQWQTPRAVLDTITAAFGVEYRVNGNGTIDVGTQAQLYGSAAKTIISARSAGNDFDLTSLGADFKTDTAVIDYTSRVVLLGQKTDTSGTSVPFVEATADALAFPYKDLHGNTVHITRAVSDSGQTDASAPAAAQLQLNQFNRTKTALQITATDYEVSGQPLVGQNAYVFDPDNGLFDPATQIDFRGELIFPQLIRISALQWPVTDGMTVAFRTQAGVWIDLTRWVVWDSQSESITVGDLPRTLTSGSNPVLSQTQSAPDPSVPNAPTGLSLSTTSYESSVGQSVATIMASWTAPALNTDGSVVTDLSYYVVRYRPQFRAPQWYSTVTSSTTIDIPGLTVGLIYDVEVAAVDLAGHWSAFTAISSITAAPDQTAPNPPSDPVVTSYLGQLRIAWDGKDNTGAGMPPDFAIVEVHVSATSGFTPVAGPGSTTLVDQLSTAGVSYATGPYGVARYVKLVSVDNSGNRSAPSGQATGTTVQVANGDIASLNVGKLVAGTMSADVVMSGRFTTALTGSRVEVNSLGVQGFQADGVTKWLSLTATESLLTGTFKTALTGRRIEIGAGGATGEIDFYSPDGKQAFVRAWTESTGKEAAQFGITVPGTDSLWNRVNFNTSTSGEYATFRSGTVEFCFDSGSDQGGSFYIFELSSKNSAVTPPAGLRYSLDSTSTRNIFPSAGLYSIEERDRNGTGWYRMLLQQNVIQFYPGSPDFGFLQMNIGGGTSSTYWYSPYITFYTPPVNSGGGRYAATLEYAINPNGTNSGLEVHGPGQVGWEAIKASAFVVSSDARSKSDPVVATDDFLAGVIGTKPKRYQRTRPDGKAGPPEIGLIAQEAPPQLVTTAGAGDLMIDLYQMVTYLWGAVGQINDTLGDLKKGKP